MSPESWVQIDFGAGVTVAIEKVLMWRSPQAPLETGVVEWSDDGLAWFVEWSLLLRTEDYATAPNSIAPATSTSPKSLGVSNNAPLLPRFGQVQYALDAGKEVYSDDGVTPIQDGEGVYLARNQSDYSGTGGGPADFVQASAALRPIWRSGGIRGRPFFDLDGTRYFQDIPFVQPSGFFALRAVILAAAVEGVDRTPGTFRSFLGGTASNKAEIYCRPGNPDAEYRAGQNGLQAGNYAPSTLAMALMPLSTTEAAFITDDFSEYRVTTGTNPPTAAVATAQVFRSSRLTDSGIMKGRVYEMAIVESASHVDLQITSAWIAGRQMAGAAPGPTVALVTQGQRAVWAGTAETLFRPWGIIRQRSGATLANEATIQGVVPTSGVLRRFRISIESNASTTATGHVVVRVNSQPSALAITVPPGETGVFEASLDAVVPVSAGDLLSISVKNSAASGGGLVDLRSTQIDFEPFDGIIRVVHGVSVQNNPSVNVSVADARFSPILAHSDSTVGWKASLTDRTRSPLGASGAITTATAYVRSNSLDATATFTLIKNDVEMLLKLAMPSGQTGRFASVGGPVSVAPGDVFSWRREITGRTAGTIDTTSLDAVFESADGSYDLLSGTELGSTTDWTAVPVGTLGFVGFGGQIFPSPNDFGSVRLPSDSVVSRLRGRAYTSNSPADFAGFLTANGSRQSPEVMFPAGFNVDTAPWVEDVSGSATLGAGDLISLGSIAPAGGTLEQYRSPIAAGITIKLSDGPPPPPSVTPPPGLLRINGQFPTLEAGQQVSAATGLLSLSGRTPTLVEFSGVTPAIGALAFSGIAPVLAFDVELASITGALAIAGYAPGVLVGVTVATEAGQLVIEGGTPGLFTISGTIASQAAMLGLGLPPAPPAHASQAVAMALAEPPPPPTRSSQAALLALGEIVPVVAASQAAILALGHGSACVSYRCQLWTIRRRDGVVFRYTSHDQPVHRGPFVYSPCRSLDPTASEN
ncbi:MAG TPA: hypothetical protein VLZ51_11910, partial [Brevundimonas sp.]|nr:hypothetical protein [Brevundimonas sp.]